MEKKYEVIYFKKSWYILIYVTIFNTTERKYMDWVPLQTGNIKFKMCFLQRKRWKEGPKIMSLLSCITTPFSNSNYVGICLSYATWIVSYKTYSYFIYKHCSTLDVLLFTSSVVIIISIFREISNNYNWMLFCYFCLQPPTFHSFWITNIFGAHFLWSTSRC